MVIRTLSVCVKKTDIEHDYCFLHKLYLLASRKLVFSATAIGDLLEKSEIVKFLVKLFKESNLESSRCVYLMNYLSLYARGLERRIKGESINRN